MLTGLLILSPTNSSAEQRPRWLAIVAPGLVEAIQPLAERRRDEGCEVRLRTVSPSEDPAESLAWVAEQAAGPATPTYLTLVGDWFVASEDCYVPPAVGRSGRMHDHPTDLPYALPTPAGAATVAVGRLPARSADELRAMIAKVTRFEDQEPGPWSNRVNLWVGHPGGNSTIEKKLAENVIQSTIGLSLESIPQVWEVRTLADFPGTPYTAPHDSFADRVVDEMEYGQCFSVYAGHSGASGWWSKGRYVVSREALASIRIEHSPGVFVTTGCYSSQLAGGDGEGYLVAAMRNPDGPVACIGAFGESYAAHGQLVMDALLECLTARRPPRHRLAFVIHPGPEFHLSWCSTTKAPTKAWLSCSRLG
ncbi:MAG: C25 family cysteine peptidase, partial [Planctomycetota bacterium]